MFISSVQISNYTAFRNTETIYFKQGINVIVGKNNVGKTALLQVLGLEFQNEPHLSLETIKNPGDAPVDNISNVVMSFSVKSLEFKAAATIENSTTIRLPTPSEIPPKEALTTLLEWIEKKKFIELQYNLSGNLQSVIPDLPSFPLYQIQSRKAKGKYDLINYIPDNSWRKYKDSGKTTVDAHNTPQGKLIPKIQNSIYKFDAERPKIGLSAFGASEVLKPDASNLPEVLDVLSKNPRRYHRFMKCVFFVLPMVKWISVENLPSKGAELEIYVWMIDPSTERKDLAIPLKKCGTGVGQVLAMLYVVFTATTPKIFIIDEPQSFLHPSAIRELIEVFKTFPEHQYIIATHSPLIISAANPATITKISHDGNEATLSQIKQDEFDELRDLLNEIGVKLSDVFGVDRILWVEGPTEEACFPLLLKNIAKNYRIMRGTHILAVKHTGDFHKKHARLTFDIYNRLSTGQAIFPPAVGFIFDSEGATDKELGDLQRQSSKLVKFLPRRLYENYLLHPEAIAAVLNDEDTYTENEITVEEIDQWITAQKKAGKYLPKGTPKDDCEEDDWYKIVDGARLLSDLFNDLSEDRVSYIKTRHSPLLTDWLLKNREEVLKELSDFLKNFLYECQVDSEKSD